MNIILTGIPRSGTTLSCALLNQLPDVLALVEPMDITLLLAQTDATARREYMTQYFSSVRCDLLNKGKVATNIVAEQGTNTFSDSRSDGGSGSGISTGKRKASLIKRGTISRDKHYGKDFRLVIKHPNAFSALLPELSSAFTCFAIIRNPLSILASWHSLDHPLSRGHAPMAEAFDAVLQSQLDAESDDLNRQLILLDWFYRQYHEFLAADHIIRYEDVVKSSGRALQCIEPSAKNLQQSLSSKNSSSLYDSVFMSEAAARLRLNTSHGAWLYYRPAELEEIIQQSGRKQ